jgi:hypothetical protein
VTAEPEGLIPAPGMLSREQVEAMFPGARPCRRPHQHPGPRYPSSLVLCHDPEHHGLAGVLGKPAPRHAGEPAIGEHVSAAPYAGGAVGLATGAYDPPEPAMAWAAELADAQGLADHAGRKLDAARADMLAAGDRIATWRRELAETQAAAQAELAAAINVLREVRDREPGKAEPEPPADPDDGTELPDARQLRAFITDMRDEWARAGADDGVPPTRSDAIVLDVLAELLAYAEGA